MFKSKNKISKRKLRLPIIYALCSMLLGAQLCAPTSANAAPSEESLYGTPGDSGNTQSRNSSRSSDDYTGPGNRIAMDTQDPMWLGDRWDILSKTYANYGNDILRVGEQLSVGLNHQFTLYGNIQYQADFNGTYDGFSGPEVGGIYRFSETGVLSDLFAGVQLGGQVRVPAFATNVYYIGARVGKQWSWVTLAGILQTSWIFDETRGMAAIDLTPTAYFRLPWDWSAGVSLDLRKSTNPNYDEQIAGGQIAKRYGRTMYVGLVQYAFENPEWRFGLQLNILF
ncbi:MAG: hypothetical protein FWC51_03295 [Proteobacteria bacterium]|nr:hypothetical protein [Pseudomonadota bacterium]